MAWVLVLAAACVSTARAAEPISVREAKRDTTGLASDLRSARPTTRAAAARALGRIQNRGSVAPLLAALADRSPHVRREAAFALGLIGDSTAAPHVAARLQREPDPGVRIELVTALGYLGARQGGPALARSIASGGTPGERQAAALAAGRARDSSLVAPLVSALRDARPELRWRAAYALGRIGKREAGPALRDAAGDASGMVRYSAARALADVGDSSAGPTLTKLLLDPEWRVRANAARALGVLRGGGSREAASALRPLLSDRHAHVRWESAAALGALRDSASVPALTAALRDSASGVVQAVAKALLDVRGDGAVPTVAPALDLLPGFLRSGLIESLGGLSGPASLEVLLARVRGSDAPLASGAASALSRRAGDRARAIPLIRERLSAADYSVVASAAEALGALGDSAAAAPLARLLAERRAGPDDADVRASAATALAALRTPEALAALRSARSDPERRIRQTAAAALGMPPDSVAAEPAPALRIDPIPPAPAASATVTTERGTFRIALRAGDAPRTVANFVRLARAGYFDGIAFHRVVPNFVIQDGCPRGDGWGGPGYAIPCEYNDRPYGVGTVGMALAGKDTGGSQWFVTLSPQPRLEGLYTVFGEVVSGMPVVERIMPGDRILRVEVR